MMLRNTIFIAALFQLFILALPAEAKQQHHSSIYNLHEATKEDVAFIEKNFASQYHEEYDSDIYPPKVTYYLAKIDLNDSGMLSYIVMPESISWCGSHGCIVDIWQKKGGQWIVTGGAADSVSKKIKKCNRTRASYHDLEYENTILYWLEGYYVQRPGHCK